MVSDTPPQRASDPSSNGWQLGPGILVAATGVGAGDLIAAAVAGQRYGVAVLWAVVAGAFCKAVLNEGLSRWQLATEETLIQGMVRRLPRWVAGYFGVYLVIWSFLVAGALGSASGFAFKALFPGAPGGIGQWTTVHALAGVGLVASGRFAIFERLMQALVGLMFVIVLVCGAMLAPQAGSIWRGLLWPTMPTGGVWFLVGLIGGVGGSVTLLCHGYWMREKGWRGLAAVRTMRWDIGVAYTLTAVFGLAMVVIAAGAQPENASGRALVLALSERLGTLFGPVGRGAFLIGFWCAVFSSLLGVWQGVPYLFADWWASWRGRSAAGGVPSHSSRAYRGFLWFLGVPPLLLLVFEKPLVVVIVYAVAGAFFMPFLAAVLLVLNNRRDWVGEARNRWRGNLALAVALALFGAILLSEVTQRWPQ